MQILGREPALILGFTSATVSLVGYQWHVSAGTQTAINAVTAAIVGLILAIMAHAGAWAAAVMQAAQAGMALFVGLGLDWPADKQALVMATLAAALALYQRTQVTAPVMSTALEEGSPIKPRAPQAV
ncbi:hypothetical protein OS965_02595 [Streptomyces sp. H27-G5]|uniref:hypothetical protein n=1 Tax=Streptomyces sp. H27-G5 TaxID=2996698 RepID=UPI002270D888|nr:hypothetical protein [Streptomyces sp. H27-G5]MCY0917066.1 hypothetical protein [Streptomyces sp. H27-G5]